MNAINSIRSYIPALQIDTPKNMLSKAKVVAIPAIALVGASMIREAAATPFTQTA